MKTLNIFLAILAFSACKKQVAWDQIPNLNGYWEIEKVSFPDGSEKKYSLNTTIDYIEINGKQGYRKKVQPKLNGTYDTSNDAEKFTLLEKEGSIGMYYKNEISEWEEKITTIDKNSFSVSDIEQITYHYKRFKPIILE